MRHVLANLARTFSLFELTRHIGLRVPVLRAGYFGPLKIRAGRPHACSNMSVTNAVGNAFEFEHAFLSRDFVERFFTSPVIAADVLARRGAAVVMLGNILMFVYFNFRPSVLS